MSDETKLQLLGPTLAASMASTYEWMIANGKTGAEAMAAVFVQYQLASAWKSATTPPDADTTVLLALSDGEVWQGYFNGIAWVEVSGLPLAKGRVQYWKHTPAHPNEGGAE